MVRAAASGSCSCNHGPKLGGWCINTNSGINDAMEHAIIVYGSFQDAELCFCRLLREGKRCLSAFLRATYFTDSLAVQRTARSIVQCHKDIGTLHALLSWI